MKFSKEYIHYIRSTEWRKKRKEAFRIFGRKCKFCGATKEIQVHHKHYRNLFKEDVVNDLEVLCRRCHMKYHGLVYKEGEMKKSKRALLRSPAPLSITMDEYRSNNRGFSTNGK